MPPAEVHIDERLVRALLRGQHPDLAKLPIGSAHEGWDNVTMRIGEKLAVRLPRRRLGAALSATELDWIPTVGADWTFPTPRALRVGEPNERYPWRWSVVPWLEGSPAYEAPLSADGARDLGEALAQVHQPSPADAPVNPFRSGPLAERAERLDLRLEALEVEHGEKIHANVARELFQAGARQPAGPVTWTHLDIHGANILTVDGRLSGLLDWGDAAAGDPAADLGQALVMVGRTNFKELFSAYADAGGAAATEGSLSESTRKRIEAEAVAYAALLAGTGEGDHATAGWAALVELGVIEPTPDRAKPPKATRKGPSRR
jgi:aminoglycoside phosphotransferase (APT) family kinase protein